MSRNRPHPNQVINQSLLTLRDRLKNTEQTVRAILDGDKPEVSPKHWLYRQIEQMHTGLFQCDPARVLVSHPGDGPDEILQKGDTRFHPLTYALIKRQENLDRFLGRAGIRNYKVFGVDDQFRDTGADLTALSADTGALILPRADLHSLWQFVSVLKERLETRQTRPLLIVQNSDGAYWNDMITGLGLDRLDETLQKRVGLHLTPGLRETEILLSGILPYKSKVPAVPAQPPVSTLIIATSGSHKIAELRRILEAQRLPKKVLALRSVLKKPREVPEDGKTCAANAMQKADAAMNMIDFDMGLDEAIAVLTRRGIDPATVMIVTDDRSLETAKNLTGHAMFDACRSYLNTYRPTPGPELALVLKSMSRDDMFKGMKLSADALSQEQKARGEDPHVDLTARNWTIYTMTPLLPDAEGKRRTRLFAGATIDSIVFRPRPQTEIIYSENYLSPVNDPRTHAEIPHYIETHSDRALAAHAVIKGLGLDQDRNKTYGLDGAFQQSARAPRWRIATQHSLRQDVRTHGPGGLAKSMVGAFKAMSGAAGKYDGAKGPEEYGVSENERVRLALRKFGALFADADCLLFAGEYDKEEAERNFFKNAVFFFSPQVGKAVADPTMAEKPYSVIVSPASQPYIALYNHLHIHGLIGDQPDNVFKKCLNPAQATNWFKRRMKSYIPDNVTENRYWETEASVRPDADMFRVAVYGSAISTNKNKRNATRNFCWDLAAMGFAVKNGGGKDGIMIESSMGVHDFRAWWTENRPERLMPKTHVSSIQCEDTRQMEGLCDFNDFACVHPTIWDRMADLSDCEAEVWDLGGGGTVQEGAVSGYLRQIGLRASKDRPLIIINSLIGEGVEKTRAYDPLIAAIPAHYLEDYNIQIVDTHDEALQILIDARRSRSMEPAITAPDALSSVIKRTLPQPISMPQLKVS